MINTDYQATEYLARLGGGDWETGLDLALAELEASGYQFLPGEPPRDPQGRPACPTLWRRGLFVQVAYLHELQRFRSGR